jgi:hypothetical protein
VPAEKMLLFFTFFPEKTPLNIMVPTSLNDSIELNYDKKSRVHYYVRTKEAINVDVDFDANQTGITIILEGQGFIEAVRHAALGRGLKYISFFIY